MEADEVYSELGEKISGITDKLSEFQGTIDSLQSTISDQKSALEKMQSSIDQINSALNDLKSGAGGSKDNDSQQKQGLDDLRKSIEAANAASEKKFADQQGLLGKLAAQADDAAKTLINFPDTAKAIANKAWEDGKKEILSTWETGKADIMNSLSSITTGLIKEAKTGIKDEIKDELKSLILDDVTQARTDAASTKPAPLTDEELEAKITTIVKQVAAEKGSA
jgi:chromosome segregation ATPase